MLDTPGREPNSEGGSLSKATAPQPSLRLSRRAFLKLAAAGVGTAALAACSPPIPQPAPRVAQKVQLVYQDSRAEWFAPMVREMLEVFHSRQPNIRVFYTPEPDGPENIQEKTLAAMQTGTAPDVFQGCCAWFPIWAQKGYLMDLRPLVEADLDRGTVQDWDAAQYRALSTRAGLQYGLPKFMGALALYYNKDIFDRYGVDYPEESWDHNQYLGAMKLLTHDRNGDGRTDLWGSMTYVTWDRIQMHVNGWGGHLVDPSDDTKIRMGDPEALAALEWLRARMQDDRVMATMIDTQNVWPSDAFAAGRLAMVEDGSWQLKNILSKADFRIGIAPFPAGPMRRVTLATNDGFGIYAGTKHPEAAWDLMKFLTGEEFGRAMARASFLQPARLSLVDDWVQYVQEQYPEKAREANIAAFADGQIKGYSVTAEVAANMSTASGMAHVAWDRILTLGQAPVESMRDVAQQIERTQRG